MRAISRDVEVLGRLYDVFPQLDGRAAIELRADGVRSVEKHAYARFSTEALIERRRVPSAVHDRGIILKI